MMTDKADRALAPFAWSMVVSTSPFFQISFAERLTRGVPSLIYSHSDIFISLAI